MLQRLYIFRYMYINVFNFFFSVSCSQEDDIFTRPEGKKGNSWISSAGHDMKQKWLYLIIGKYFSIYNLLQLKPKLICSQMLEQNSLASLWRSRAHCLYYRKGSYSVLRLVVLLLPQLPHPSPWPVLEENLILDNVVSFGKG